MRARFPEPDMDIRNCQYKIEKSKHCRGARNGTGERRDERGVLEREKRTRPEKRRAGRKPAPRPPERLIIKPPRGFTWVGERMRRKRLGRRNRHPAAPECCVQVAVFNDAVPDARLAADSLVRALAHQKVVAHARAADTCDVERVGGGEKKLQLEPLDKREYSAAPPRNCRVAEHHVVAPGRAAGPRCEPIPGKPHIGVGEQEPFVAAARRPRVERLLLAGEPDAGVVDRVDKGKRRRKRAYEWFN